jgi:hypothetical protein
VCVSDAAQPVICRPAFVDINIRKARLQEGLHRCKNRVVLDFSSAGMGAPRRNRFAIFFGRLRVRGRDEVFSVPSGELVTGSGPAFRGPIIAPHFGLIAYFVA